MITREHTKDETRSSAVYSPCERYRYSLTRCWDETRQRLLYVMLNPSTATETQNDPTVERCERRARHLRFGAFRVINLFAWCATDPKDMRSADDPVGPKNDATILEGASWANTIIAAWGIHGTHHDRAATVALMLHRQGTPLYHLGLTRAGHPRHPLYVPYAQRPEPWNARR